MSGLLKAVVRDVRGDICIPTETALQRNGDSQVVSPQELKAFRSAETERYPPGSIPTNPLASNDLGPLQPRATIPTAPNLAAPYSFELDDLDLCDDFLTLGWLVALPEPPAGPLCPVHGSGYWWEGRHDGRLHCVACWSAPPIRSMVVRVWQSARGDAPILAGCGFAPDQIVFVTRTDGAAPWPWQDNQPAEPAELSR